LAVCFWPTAAGHDSIKINVSYLKMHESTHQPVVPTNQCRW
jgi:hypothetical protein